MFPVIADDKRYVNGILTSFLYPFQYKIRGTKPLSFICEKTVWECWGEEVLFTIHVTNYALKSWQDYWATLCDLSGFTFVGVLNRVLGKSHATLTKDDCKRIEEILRRLAFTAKSGFKGKSVRELWRHLERQQERLSSAKESSHHSWHRVRRLWTKFFELV